MYSFLCHFSLGAQGPLRETKVKKVIVNYKKQQHMPLCNTHTHTLTHTHTHTHTISRTAGNDRSI